MKWSFIFVILFALILFNGISSAWSINQFNNSLTSETLNFDGINNITRYLAIPSSVSALANFYFNLSGYTGGFPYGTKSYWNMDATSGTNEADSVGGLNNLTWTGSMTYVPGILTNAANFTGSNYLISKNKLGTQFNGTANRTLAMWVKSTANNPVSGNGYLLATYGTCSAGKAFGIYIYQNKYEYLGCGGDFELGATANNSWVFLVLTYNGTNIKSYVNANLTHDNVVALNTGDGNLTIGTRFDSPGTDNAINTSIDEVGLWNRTLSQSEITSLYNNGIGSRYSDIGIATTNLFIGGENMNLPILANGTTPINITIGNASNINNYLLSCSYVSGYCNIPFMFSSSAVGQLSYSSILGNDLGFVENNQTYNSSVYETDAQNFNINITYNNLLLFYQLRLLHRH